MQSGFLGEQHLEAKVVQGRDVALADRADVVVVATRHDVLHLLLLTEVVGDARVHIDRHLLVGMRAIVVRVQLRHAVRVGVPAPAAK